ncbi:MAG: ATP-binding cassette domain-containing protein [Mycoplasmataceae bacterium]|nr:ATP-binding cassette domain-containing protein [Mycoplasmataceae bacterium]
MKLNIKNISKIYGENTKDEFQALKDVSFRVNPGESIGIIGPTGSGKSTLLNIISGLTKATSGEISYDDFNFTTKTKLKKFNKIRDKISISYQNPDLQLFKETVFNDIALSLDKNKYTEEEINKKVHDVIKIVNLNPDLLNKVPFNLSSGEKRKVILASLLISEPEVLVFDEPTAHLDPASTKVFVETIRKLNRKYNKSLIIVSHDLEIINQLTTRTLFLKDGIVYAKGKTTDILNRNLLLTSAKMIPKAKK